MASELQIDEVLRVLLHNEVEFIVVGGVAAILRGSPLTTDDLDIVYRSTKENNTQLAKALGQLEAYYFDPAGREIEPNVSRLSSMRLHLLETNCGSVDVLQAVGKNLTYEDLLPNTSMIDIADFQVCTLNLKTIIETKEHANRPKDRYQLPYLRQLVAEIQDLDAE